MTTGIIVALIVLGVAVTVAINLRSGRESSASTERVWSKEHKHWHNVPKGVPGPQPPGPAPLGKVWSEEHGHWHDAQASAPGPQPPGEAPPGKVWSEEHGHWHDAP